MLGRKSFRADSESLATGRAPSQDTLRAQVTFTPVLELDLGACVPGKVQMHVGFRLDDAHEFQIRKVGETIRQGEMAASVQLGPLRLDDSRQQRQFRKVPLKIPQCLVHPKLITHIVQLCEHLQYSGLNLRDAVHDGNEWKILR